MKFEMPLYGIIMALGLLLTQAHAEIPQTINFQGILTDSCRNPLTATKEMVFAIYSDSVGGSCLWDETQSAVEIQDGLFMVRLGAVNPIPPSIFTGGLFWLGITVGGDLGELLPRQELDTAPYCFHSEYSDTAVFSTSGAPDDDWTTSGTDVYRVEGNIGIGTANPSNKLHVNGTETMPIVNIEQFGFGRGLRVQSQYACAIWVEHSGHHGLRVTNADGDGVHVEDANNNGIHVDHAGNWAGYFNGDGYFGGNVGIGTTTPTYPLDVAGDIQCSALHETSDLRLKTDIAPVTDALCKIEQLRGVTFHWNRDGESLGGAHGQDQIGVIAQDVEQVFPQLVTTSANGYKSVDYTKLTAVLIEAVKELQARVEKLEYENRALRQDLKR